MRVLLILVLALGCILGWFAAQAQLPSCTAESVGVVACIAGRLCSCDQHPAGATGSPPMGSGWNCGILRPPCPPPSIDTDPYWPLLRPDALELELRAPRRP